MVARRVQERAIPTSVTRSMPSPVVLSRFSTAIRPFATPRTPPPTPSHPVRTNISPSTRPIPIRTTRVSAFSTPNRPVSIPPTTVVRRDIARPSTVSATVRTTTVQNRPETQFVRTTTVQNRPVSTVPSPNRPISRPPTTVSVPNPRSALISSLERPNSTPRAPVSTTVLPQRKGPAPVSSVERSDRVAQSTPTTVSSPRQPERAPVSSVSVIREQRRAAPVPTTSTVSRISPRLPEEVVLSRQVIPSQGQLIQSVRPVPKQQVSGIAPFQGAGPVTKPPRIPSQILRVGQL